MSLKPGIFWPTRHRVNRIKDLDGLCIGMYSESGGSGSLLIDDIRLTRTAPRCETAGFIDGDQNGDCRIDMVDLSFFAAQWLE
ncbi:MAG: hypothetical protein ABFR90_05265 [Planctomycetota bacterium]